MCAIFRCPNKRLGPEEVRATLALQSMNKKNFEINKKPQA